jgi:magnesium transporter
LRTAGVLGCDWALREWQAGANVPKLQLRQQPQQNLLDLIRRDRWTDVLGIAKALHPSDLATDVQRLPPRHQRSLFKCLSTDTAAALLLYLLPYDQFILLHARPRADMRKIAEAMHPDDLMRLLDELPEASWQQLTDELSESQRQLTERLAKYAEDCAGRYITPAYLALGPETTVEQALYEIRSKGRSKETVDVSYVVDSNGKLVDEVSLSSLVMAPAAQKVMDVSDSPLITVKDTDVLEDVLALFEKYDRTALPVVDEEHKMLGILTVDDVMDIARISATRELQKMGGMEALDAPYFNVDFREMFRKRGTWLALLFLGEMLTATAMTHFQNEMAAAIVLALFVPLIISSGGNSGSQATSLLIRSLALREISVGDWWRVCGRELVLGASLGAFLGAIGFLRIVAWQWLQLTNYGPHYLRVAGTVWCSLIGVVGFGTIAGSMLPFLLRRFGFDPATSSAPLVATLVDVSGLVIYFSIARLILRGVLL